MANIKLQNKNGSNKYQIPSVISKRITGTSSASTGTIPTNISISEYNLVGAYSNNVTTWYEVKVRIADNLYYCGLFNFVAAGSILLNTPYDITLLLIPK